MRFNLNPTHEVVCERKIAGAQTGSPMEELYKFTTVPKKTNVELFLDFLKENTQFLRQEIKRIDEKYPRLLGK